MNNETREFVQRVIVELEAKRAFARRDGRMLSSSGYPDDADLSYMRAVGFGEAVATIRRLAAELEKESAK